LYLARPNGKIERMPPTRMAMNVIKRYINVNLIFGLISLPDKNLIKEYNPPIIPNNNIGLVIRLGRSITNNSTNNLIVFVKTNNNNPIIFLSKPEVKKYKGIISGLFIAAKSVKT
jgi:hypothetical protein